MNLDARSSLNWYPGSNASVGEKDVEAQEQTMFSSTELSTATLIDIILIPHKSNLIFAVVLMNSQSIQVF